jgi:hypothetical protein
MAAIRLIPFAGLALALLSGCVTPPEQTASARLVGKWSNVKDFDEMRVENATEIRSDGTLDRRGVIRDVKGSRPYSARGFWRIEKSVFYEKIEWTDFPGWKPGAPEMAWDLAAVTDWEWVLKDQATGAETRFWRYPK